MKHKKYSLFVGRWQPFHRGHEALIRKVLAEGKNVLIAIRDTNKSKQNPYNLSDRFKMIRKVFPGTKRVEVISIPDIDEIVYGREVGYKIRELKLPKKIEKISATKIRNKKYRIIN